MRGVTPAEYPLQHRHGPVLSQVWIKA